MFEELERLETKRKILKEQKDDSEEHDESVEIFKTEVTWPTSRVEKAIRAQYSMSIENHENKNHALIKQEMKLKMESES